MHFSLNISQFTLELGRRYSGYRIGTPIKKLLAEEMSKERESRRRSPSIIARLMGVEELPPQQPSHKQQKRSSDRYQPRTESVGLVRNNALYEDCSFRKSSKEEQEFKDVYEVVETPKMGSSSYPVQRNVNSKLTEAKMALFRQKVMDAKRLSTDERLQGTKEFDDTLEVLDSNKDLFLKCLQEPNSLFVKHLHDLQGPLRQSHCRHVVVRKKSEARKCSSNDIGDRETKLKNHTTSRQKHYDDSLNRPYHKGTHNPLKSSRVRLEDKNETSAPPTMIVVLKPYLGTAHSVSKPVSSPHSSHTSLSDSRMQTELPNVKGRKPEMRRNKNMSDDEGIWRHKSKESREIAKKITRRMKNSLSAGSLNLSSSGFKGYAGDESSCCDSGNDSETESEVTTLTSRKSIDWNDRQRLSLSHSSDSPSVNREATKRLSERWKMTHRFQEVGLVGRSSTLGEMLAIPDREVKTEILDSIIDQDGRRVRFAGIEGFAKGVCPLGISSKEGWKDGCIRNLSRSRSLPASSAASGSFKASTRRGTLGDDRYLMRNEAINLGRNKAVKKHSNRKEGSFSSNSRSDPRESKSSQYTDREGSDTVQKSHVCQNQIKSILEVDGTSEPKIMISETSICNITERSLVVDAVADVEHENMISSSESPSELLAERSAWISVRDDSPTRELDNTAAKEISNGLSEEGAVTLSRSICESESPASSKEAEQPSPVSVLEAPFSGDLSSGSDCFGSLSADLQGLRMQLQLLKLESEEYEEGAMVISSDEDVAEESVVTKERGTFRTEESWESSFVVDVLIDSGFCDADPDTFMATWHSPECPIDHSVYQKLEKKYYDQASWLTSERKLLFDRINSGLVEIFQQFMDPHPWVKPLEKLVGPKRSKDMLKDDLCNLLAIQEKKANKEDPTENVLGRESQWLDLEDNIDVIGRELERLMIDELVVEVVTI